MLDSVIVGIFIDGSGTIDTESCADHLVDLSVNTTLKVDTVLLIAFVDTFLAVVANTEMVIDALTAPIHCQIVVLLATVLGHQVRPVVCGSICQHFFHLKVSRTNVLTQQTLLKNGTANLISRVSCWECGTIGSSISEELHETIVVERLPIHKVRHTHFFRPSVVSVIADGRLLVALHSCTALGGYHHDTCRGARTIDGG